MTQQLQPSQATPQDAPTLVLAERYHVFEVLGRGGMASVHRGIDQRLDRPVAIKLLHDHLADDPRVRDRFRREAVAAARLNHPGIVAVYDHWKGGDANPPFLVMELVGAGSVRGVLDLRGALTPGQTVALLRPAMVGLADAHRQGIVHRDVTPANVLVGADGASKLGDFGLARAAAASTATFPEGVVGSPHYISPEAVRGEPLDARADVYSLGCVLFECLTGRPPFDGDNAHAIAAQHGVDRVPPPSSVVPRLPRRLDDVVARATAIDPAQRFPDASAMVVAFDEAVPDGPEAIDLRTRTTNLRIDPAHATTVLDDDPTTLAVAARTDDARRRWWWVAVAVALVVVLAGGGWLGYDRVIAPVTPIDDVRGEPLDVARDALEGDGFRVLVAEDEVFDRSVPAGGVLQQTPRGEARRGTTVTLVPSAGPRTGTLPAVVGRAQDAAVDAIEALDLDLEVTTEPGYDDEAAPGTVLSSTPTSGGTVTEGGQVVLTISAGPAPVDVPALRGEGQASAESALADVGLTGAVVERRYSDDVPQDAVIESRPPAGTELRRGDEVGLVLSRGAEPIEVPDVRGLSEEDARRTLEALGFEVAVQYVPRILPIKLGAVDDQAPSAGQVRVKGSTVRIFVWELA